MPSERAANWFGDIVRACEQIEQWVLEVGGIDRIMANEMARSAVERQLLIISEAAIRLRNVDDDIADLHPRSIGLAFEAWVTSSVIDMTT